MRITGLYVYPVKACRGIAVTEAALTRRGLQHDRRYMIVDRAGVFVSQRTIPRLALVTTALEEHRITLTAAGFPPLVIETEHESGERLEVEVWSHRGRAVRHAAGSEWLSDFLGDAVSLVYMPEDEERPVNPARARPGDLVSFADAYPLLLIGQASLDDLNAHLETPITMERFRPNIVFDAGTPYVEDTFQRVEIGGLSFRGVKRCDRCAVTTVDPDTGHRGKEPLRTLARYRLEDGKVWFGMNLIHDASGTLRVGDTVRPLAEKAQPPSA